MKFGKNGGKNEVPAEVQQFAPKPARPIREIIGEALPHIIDKMAERMVAQIADEDERAKNICSDLDAFVEDVHQIVDSFKNERMAAADSARSQVSALTDNMRKLAQLETQRIVEFCDQSDAALKTMINARATFEQHYPVLPPAPRIDEKALNAAIVAAVEPPKATEEPQQ